MAVHEHELVPVARGVAHDHEAAVEVEELGGEALVDGVAATGGRLRTKRRQGEQTGVDGADRLVEGIGEIGAVEVVREVRRVVGEGGGDERALVHVVAAVGVGVDLLEEDEVGSRAVLVDRGDERDVAVGAGKLALLAHGARMLAHGLGAVGEIALVHEEGVVGRVGAEADVVGHRRVGLSHVDGAWRRRGGGDLGGGVVRDARVVGLEIDDVDAQHRHGEKNDGEDGGEYVLDDLGHDLSPFN